MDAEMLEFSAERTVIVALPFPTAVTVMDVAVVLEIVIFEELLVDQITPLFEAFEGEITAVNVLVPVNVDVEPEIEIPVTGIAVTVSATDLLIPSTVTVSVVLPVVTGVSVTVLLTLSIVTVAILVLATLAVIILLIAVVGKISTLSVLTALNDTLETVIAPSLTFTAVTRKPVTLTVNVSVTPLAVLVTVITVIPSVTGVTVKFCPETETVAIPGLDDTAVIVLSVVPLGKVKTE